MKHSFGVTRTAIETLRQAYPTISAKDLAKALGVTRPAIYQHLRGMGLPTSPGIDSPARHIRFPSKLYMKAKEAATRKGMRINQFLIYAVEQHLKQGN